MRADQLLPRTLRTKGSDDEIWNHTTGWGRAAEEIVVYESHTPTLRVIGEIEGGVKIIDQATGVAIFAVIRVVLG